MPWNNNRVRLTSGPHTPMTQRRDEFEERGCGRCRTPYGLSTEHCTTCGRNAPTTPEPASAAPDIHAAREAQAAAFFARLTD